MKNADYWQKRFKTLEGSQNKDALQRLDDLERRFNLAQKTIDDQIRVWYSRFADNNQISLSEAHKLLNGKELAELRWDVNEYIKYGKENALNGQWVKQLENASAKFHVSRLEALKLQTQHTVEKLYGNQIDAIDNLMKRTYLDSYYHSIYEVQRGVGVGWDISGINEKQIQSVLSKPWTVDKETFSDRVWLQKDKLINEVHTQLTQNMILGRSPDESIRAIAAKFNTSKANAGRLVMTESAYFTSLAEKDAFQELGVEEFQIIGTLDGKTCPLCGGMDGKTCRVSRFAAGITAPPFHPWCRCTTAPYFGDEAGERIARDNESKTYYVPSDIKYNDWKKAFIDKTKPLPPKQQSTNTSVGLNIGRNTGIIKIEECKTVGDVENIMKSQRWFNVETVNGVIYDTNERISLKGVDLEAAKQIYISHEEVFKKYPQLVGKLNSINTAVLKPNVYAQCHVGRGRGGIIVNSTKYADNVKLSQSYLRDVTSGYHPIGTDWTSIVTHEIGHAIDDFLTNKLGVSGMVNAWKPKYVSADLRPKVMRACGLKVSDICQEVSGYATKNHFEFFAESFAEFIKSSNPRQVAVEFGRQLDAILKGVI
jgi:SPP1 gp7 family putative phage head morphogenesis protein